MPRKAAPKLASPARSTARDTPSAGSPYGQAAALDRGMAAAPTAPAMSTRDAARAYDLPSQGSFARPTERPEEPLTAGLPFGPGPGPEALLRRPEQEPSLDAQDAEALRSRLPFIEFMASQPGASPSTRLIARRLRGQLGG